MPGPYVGETAPDVIWPRSLDAVLTGSACLAHGHVLLHFAVCDFGTICTQEWSQLRGQGTQGQAVGGQVIAVAVSKVFASQVFARQLRVGFPLLSDWHRTVARVYGMQ